MNKNRSPFGDKEKLSRIGIVLTAIVMIILITNILNSRSSITTTKASSNETDSRGEVKVTLEEVKEVSKEEEPIKINSSTSIPVPSDVLIKLNEYDEQQKIENGYYLPDSARRQLEQAKQLEEEEKENEVQYNDQSYYGYFELTAYTWTGNPCADGVYPSSGYTCACNDPGLWHHWIYIEGYGTLYVHDTGGMASNVIDIYMDSYDACIQFGRRTANIYIVD